MKKKIFNTVLLCFLTLASMAQVVPYVVYPQDANHTLTIQNTSDFGSGQYGGASNQRAYYPICAASRNVNFQVSFPNPSINGDVKYYIEIYRVPFSTLDGTPYYSASITAPPAVRVYISGESTVNTSAVSLNHYTSLTIDPNYYYFALAIHKKRNVFGVYQLSWTQAHTNNVNFITGTGDTYADGSINTVSNVTKPSIYGNMSVGEICLTNQTYLYASATTCEDRYGVEVQEFDLMTWTGVGTSYSTLWQMGQAGTINLTTLYGGGAFTYGKVYKVRLFAGPTWSTKDFFITPAAPVVNTTINRVSTRQVTITLFPSGIQQYYTISKITNCDNVILTLGTTCATRHKVDIDLMSASFTPVTPNFSSGWISGIPATYNVSTLSGNSLGGGIYRVTYSTGDPVTTRIFYIEFANCPRSLTIENEGLASVDETKLVDISVYPNPSSGIFNVRFNVPVSGVVNVYDMVGKNVNQLRINNESSDYSFDLSGHAKGMYILDGMINGNKYTRKIILE